MESRSQKTKTKVHGCSAKKNKKFQFVIFLCVRTKRKLITLVYIEPKQCFANIRENMTKSSFLSEKKKKKWK